MQTASTIHTGTYGTSYDADGEVVAKAKVQHGKRGRPPKVAAVPATFVFANDPFGRNPNIAPKGTKGTVIVGKAGMSAVYANDEE